MIIGIIIGSIRDGRFGTQIGQWVAEQSTDRSTQYTLIELASFDVPLLTSSTLPAMANKTYDDARVQAWSDAIDACDGFVFVTPEYNHSLPGAFKNAFDCLGAEWMGKPLAFVGYAAEGGIRAVEAWRLAVANFSMPQVRETLALRIFEEQDGNGAFQPHERRAGELAKLLDGLEALVTT